MLRASAKGEKNGRPHHLMVVGLSDMNLQKLREGKPIKFDLQEMGLPEGTAIIFWGKTEAHMHEQMQELIGPDTRVRIDPRLKS